MVKGGLGKFGPKLRDCSPECCKVCCRCTRSNCWTLQSPMTELPRWTCIVFSQPTPAFGTKFVPRETLKSGEYVAGAVTNPRRGTRFPSDPRLWSPDNNI